MVALLLGIFWTMQVVANVTFKYGSTAPQRWLPCFLLGNVVGASSIFFLMKLFARLNTNLAMALASGGAFLCIQLALALVFRTRPTLLQALGVTVVALGMILASVGTPPKP